MSGGNLGRIAYILIGFYYAFVFGFDNSELQQRIDEENLRMKVLTSKIAQDNLETRVRQEEQMHALQERMKKLSEAELRFEVDTSISQRSPQNLKPSNTNVGLDQIDKFYTVMESKRTSPANYKTPTGSQAILLSHGVDDALVIEINRMAQSFISREAIAKHVSSHYPNKVRFTTYLLS